MSHPSTLGDPRPALLLVLAIAIAVGIGVSVFVARSVDASTVEA